VDCQADPVQAFTLVRKVGQGQGKLFCHAVNVDFFGSAPVTVNDIECRPCEEDGAETLQTCGGQKQYVSAYCHPNDVQSCSGYSLADEDLAYAYFGCLTSLDLTSGDTGVPVPLQVESPQACLDTCYNHIPPWNVALLAIDDMQNTQCYCLQAETSPFGSMVRFYVLPIEYARH
jgi:hypothetical protein